MRLRVCIFSPDQHLLYDGRTPDWHGVGGGVTARVRLARALARLGHPVMVVCHCPREECFDGVQYIPLESIHRIDTDVLILNTTGGGMNVEPVLTLEVQCLLRIVWAGGIYKPRGADEVDPDYFVAPSNFVRRVMSDEWKVPSDRIFVVYNGVNRSRFRVSLFRRPKRDPFRLVYVGHPEKGLPAALSVLSLLRARDERFTLHVFGGYSLWGEEERGVFPAPGLVYRGLIGQDRLVRELLLSSFMLNLQARPEPFGIGVAEAMAAGCIVLASPAGALAEIVRDGFNGFLIPGDHNAPEVHARAEQLIVDLIRRPEFANHIRQNAKSTPLDWSTVARVWQGFFTWAVQAKGSAAALAQMKIHGTCVECSSYQILLADGYHCIHCGHHTSIA